MLDYGINLIAQSNGKYICICPFHDDINPSMRIYPETGTFHCFGCGAGHSVFEFVMRMEGIEFKDALYRLAEKVGYTATFVLRDIEVKQIDENFITQRERIENTLHQKVRNIYEILYKANVSSKKVLYEHFDNLWRWYDKQQYLFNKKIFEGHNTAHLVVILYRFHEVFLRRLQKLENDLIGGSNAK